MYSKRTDPIARNPGATVRIISGLLRTPNGRKHIKKTKMMSKPKPPIPLGTKVRIAKRKIAVVVHKEFNPAYAPRSNQWYYTLSDDECRHYREDYLNEKRFGKQQTIF